MHIRIYWKKYATFTKNKLVTIIIQAQQYPPTQIPYELRHNVQKLHTFHDVTKEHRHQVSDYARRRVQSGNRIYLDQIRNEIVCDQEICSEQLKSFFAVQRRVLNSLQHGVNTLAHSRKYQFIPDVFLTNLSETWNRKTSVTRKYQHNCNIL